MKREKWTAPAEKKTASFLKTVRRPAIPMVLSLMVGLTLGDRIPEPFPPAFFWLFLVFLPTFFTLALFMRPLALWMGCAFLLFIGLGLATYLSPRSTTPPVPPHLIASPLGHLSGVIAEEPRRFRDRVRLIIRLTAYQEQGREYPAQGKILLTVKIPFSPLGGETVKPLSDRISAPPLSSSNDPGFFSKQQDPAKNTSPLFHLIAGDPIRFVCRLRPVEDYHNPGGFDRERTLARQGIRVLGFLDDPDLIVIGGPNPRPRGLKHLSLLRNRVSGWIDDHVSFPASSLARAVLTGDQSQIPQEIQEAYARAGVSHLLAFSGLNLSLVAGLSFFFFRRFLSLSERVLLSINVRKWALIATFFPVLGYALLAGMNPPAVRAFLMVALAILALLLKRYSDLLNSLALAALVLLLIVPDALFGPSFQLSFLSVWAIAFLLPRLWNPNRFPSVERPDLWRRLGFYLWGTFCLSLVCQLATAPLVIWWFHQISFIGLLSNIFLVPLTGALITPVGLLGLVVAPLSPGLSSFLFSLMDFLLRISLWGVRFFSSLPFAYLPLPRPAWPEMATFFILITLVFHHRRISRWVFWVPLTALAMVFFYYLPHLQDAFQRPLRVHFLDVGQGNAALVEFPKGEKMLIDGGGSMNNDFDLGQWVVAPFLWSKKIGGLDLVVLTHPHPDHLNGLPYLLSRFRVKEVWTNGKETASESFLRFQGLIREKGIPLFCPPTGWARTFGDVRVEVLFSPCARKGPPRPSDPWSAENNDSLVLRIVHGGEQILFPADLEAEGEKALLSKQANIQSRILQVPHHGSLTSSTEDFIQAVHPAWAVISCRGSLRSPLPYPEVVNRYIRRGIKVLRTDQEGLITFTLLRGKWRVESQRRGLLAEQRIEKY